VQVRRLVDDDESALRAFFQAIPDEDRGFFKEDLDEPAILARWIGDERGVRIVACDDDGRLAGVAAVWPGIGRSTHVGDLRLVVARERRGQGLGRLLARRALADALREGMWKITVEVVADQQGTIDMFMALGYVAEALLRDQLALPDGETQDVVLLSHFADEAGQDVLLAVPDEASE
jgi:GNAT superfamily N-acetyltransferase